MTTTSMSDMGTRTLHPWDRARARRLYRIPGYSIPRAGWRNPEKLDAGVNYFVLALEQAGATTLFSCEGHPTGFYVAFEASYDLARRIASAGFMDITIRGDGWRAAFPTESLWQNERHKRRTLRWAAGAWERTLGPLA
jgi:hypothetical protein